MSKNKNEYIGDYVKPNNWRQIPRDKRHLESEILEPDLRVNEDNDKNNNQVVNYINSREEYNIWKKSLITEYLEKNRLDLIMKLEPDEYVEDIINNFEDRRMELLNKLSKKERAHIEALLIEDKIIKGNIEIKVDNEEEEELDPDMVRALKLLDDFDEELKRDIEELKKENKND